MARFEDTKTSLNIKESRTLNNCLQICYWNGGGALVKRLRSNPMLRRIILRDNVDIFCHGETQALRNDLKLLCGFDSYFHDANLSNKSDNYRRGLAIFFRSKYKYSISKVYACRKFDIVWMRLVTSKENIYFCFFYAPGEHHDTPIRRSFYDFFTKA